LQIGVAANYGGELILACSVQQAASRQLLFCGYCLNKCPRRVLRSFLQLIFSLAERCDSFFTL
jgi:hypothetical protein